MRIAILISGYNRTFDSNIDNLFSNIIQEHTTDIFLHITDKQDEDKYLNNPININVIKQKLKPKISIINSNLKFSSNPKINNLLNQHYKFFQLNLLKNQISKIENIKYDLVIKYRPDLYFYDAINFNNLKNDTIYIPSDSKIDKKKLKSINDNYLCDTFAYGTDSVMNIYFEIFNHCSELSSTYGDVPETIQYHYLKKFNINYVLIDLNYMILLSKCNLIAITGDSGSGKTTLSNYLKGLFNNSFSLECDRYHKWERNDKNWKNYTHLNPEANYICKMQKDVFDLKYGKKIYQINYDHNTGKFTDLSLIESQSNLIVCGLHSHYNQNNIINLKIFMDTDNQVKIPWKINRDTKNRGYSKEKILKQIQDRKNDYQLYILPQKYESDLIINFFIKHDKLQLKLGISNKLNFKDIINTFKNFNIKFNLETELNFSYLVFSNYDFNYELFQNIDYIKNNSFLPYYNIIIYLVIKLNILN
jgi:uridine kinase